MGGRRCRIRRAPARSSLASPNQPIFFTPLFNLQGTSIRQGDFKRNLADASEVGLRLHGVTDIPYINMQGFEFTANYF